jgi:hypothetical protein
MGNGTVEALFLAEEVEVVWGSGRAFEPEGGWTGGRPIPIEVRSWFALIPQASLALENPDSGSSSLHRLVDPIFHFLLIFSYIQQQKRSYCGEYLSDV